MIDRLTGTLVALDQDSCVLDISGVGFILGISAVCASRLPAVGSQDVQLFCRMVVREDDISLYGFIDREERLLFDKLRAISKVGPKLTLSILSTYSVPQLAQVVMSEDLSRLTAIPGVGKTTAQRLLIELRGIYEKNPDLKMLCQGQTEAASAVGAKNASASHLSEVIEALLAMGFTEVEAETALVDYDKAGIDSVQSGLNYALKRLGSR